jgi:spore germination cell wall hydrolase CwlJ-like protein
MSRMSAMKNRMASMVSLAALLAGTPPNLVWGAPPARLAHTATIDLVAALLIAEAGVDGCQVMLAVAEVVRNRAKARQLSIRQCVVWPRWFSSFNGRTEWGFVHEHRSNKRWDKAVELARQLVYNQLETDIVNGATHFDRQVPSWARGIKPVAKIGRHQFWRLW